MPNAVGVLLHCGDRSRGHPGRALHARKKPSVEALGPIDVGEELHHNLELHLHDPDAGISVELALLIWTRLISPRRSVIGTTVTLRALRRSVCNVSAVSHAYLMGVFDLDRGRRR